jgi:hypothetical protein
MREAFVIVSTALFLSMAESGVSFSDYARSYTHGAHLHAAAALL